MIHALYLKETACWDAPAHPNHKNKKRLHSHVTSFFSAEWTGLEPATPCVTGMYSNQLNYHSVLPGETPGRGCKYSHDFLFRKVFFKT